MPELLILKERTPIFALLEGLRIIALFIYNTIENC